MNYAEFEDGETLHHCMSEDGTTLYIISEDEAQRRSADHRYVSATVESVDPATNTIWLKSIPLKENDHAA